MMRVLYQIRHGAFWYNIRHTGKRNTRNGTLFNQDIRLRTQES
jgi:hypothetical protein